ncbi:MAG TPA: hypothetical protein VGH28_25535 [Polyangiaceae bacterium]|jgi:hypothetical protein
MRRAPILAALAVSLGLSARARAQTDAGVQQPEPQPQATQAPAPPPPPQVQPREHAPIVDVMTLRIMRQKGILTEAEYRAARGDLAETIGDERADESVNVVVGKWSATVYGFLESDFILDSTQSFNDLAGNALVQRPIGAPQPAGPPVSQYAGSNARLQFSIRNTRFGLRLRAPELHGIRASGTLEMDFLGGSSAPASGEAAFFNSPTLRLRHAYLKVETPIVDVLAGQTWHLFGWQPCYFPNTVEIQGVPGQLYDRVAQVRLSHRFVAGPTSFEIAAAALRPPTRDGGMPDLAGGLRFAVDKWRGLQTTGAASTDLAPLSIAVTGDYRNFRLPVFQSLPTDSVDLSTGAIAVDAFIPIVPATPHRRGNALSISGEFVYGGGISDMYTGLTGGVTMPSFVNSTGIANAPSYQQTVDNGMVVFDNCPKTYAPGATSCNDLHAIVWMTAIGGIQYYLPGVNGRIWISANYAHTESPNIQDFTTTSAPNALASTYAQQANVRKSEDWADGNLFLEPHPSVRIGLEYAIFIDHYVDGVTATNHRGQVSGFFLF